MSKGICWRDCKNQPPLVDDGELVLMDSNGKFWVGFCKITSYGVAYFANNAEPLKNDFVKYARIENLLAVESEFEHTRKALDVAWDRLEKIGSGNIIEHSVVGHEDDNKIFIANKALAESKTTLEQKDVK